MKDQNGKKRVKVSVKIKSGPSMGMAHEPDRDPMVRVEKAKNGFIISSYAGGGKEEKEFVKNLMKAPAILKNIFNVGNKSYPQIREMCDDDED